MPSFRRPYATIEANHVRRSVSRQSDPQTGAVWASVHVPDGRGDVHTVEIHSRRVEGNTVVLGVWLRTGHSSKGLTQGLRLLSSVTITEDNHVTVKQEPQP